MKPGNILICICLLVLAASAYRMCTAPEHEDPRESQASPAARRPAGSEVRLRSTLRKGRQRHAAASRDTLRRARTDSTHADTARRHRAYRDPFGRREISKALREARRRRLIDDRR